MCVFWFPPQLLCETFFIPRFIERDMIRNVYGLRVKVSVTFVRF